MKIFKLSCLVFIIVSSQAISAEEFNPEKFALNYFKAWTATQSPEANKENIEHYLALLTDDIGHQHLPYDPDDSRDAEGKNNMRTGMTYYLGAHTEYKAKLLSYLGGHNVVILKYESFSKGIHPQTKQVVNQNKLTLEVLEIEEGKVSVIRKYND